ncbi:MAG: hypothetical protein Q9227_008605 [Pyrenula ochraceoflavens]
MGDTPGAQTALHYPRLRSDITKVSQAQRDDFSVAKRFPEHLSQLIEEYAVQFPGHTASIPCAYQYRPSARDSLNRIKGKNDKKSKLAKWFHVDSGNEVGVVDFAYKDYGWFIVAKGSPLKASVIIKSSTSNGNGWSAWSIWHGIKGFEKVPSFRKIAQENSDSDEVSGDDEKSAYHEDSEDECSDEEDDPDFTQKSLTSQSTRSASSLNSAQISRIRDSQISIAPSPPGRQRPRPHSVSKQNEEPKQFSAPQQSRRKLNSIATPSISDQNPLERCTIHFDGKFPRSIPFTACRTVQHLFDYATAADLDEDKDPLILLCSFDTGAQDTAVKDSTDDFDRLKETIRFQRSRRMVVRVVRKASSQRF